MANDEDRPEEPVADEECEMGVTTPFSSAENQDAGRPDILKPGNSVQGSFQLHIGHERRSVLRRLTGRFTTTDPIAVIACAVLLGVTALLLGLSHIPLKIALICVGILSVTHGVSVIVEKEVTQFPENSSGEITGPTTYVGSAAVVLGIGITCIGALMLIGMLWL